MFIEFQTKDDKAISYNVNNIVFVGDMKESVSVMFDDNSHVIFTDEYGGVVKRLIGLTKAIVDPSVYVQFETRKEERIAFPIRRLFLPCRLCFSSPCYNLVKLQFAYRH